MEVYRRIYVRKSSFTALLTRCRKTKISDRISDDIPPQMKILNTVIPKICAKAYDKYKNLADIFLKPWKLYRFLLISYIQKSHVLVHIYLVPN